MVLLIEYVLDYPDGVPQRAIVAAMHTLGYTPEATRQALSRAVRAGALIQSGRGTNAHIKLSDDARGPLVEARTRLERGPGAPEAEEWLILIVRARDTEGTTAYSRRTTLLLNGLGSLGGGVWIRPKTGPFDEIVAMVNEDPAVATVAMTARIDHPTMGEVAAQAWDISAIATGYDELLADFADREAAGPEEQFRAWTEFVDSWQRVGKLDPELPTAALGSGSSRPAALMLVERLRTSWRPAAQAYFRSLVD
jgi:phenylacetic acid degradation operon negative regulatory protein